MGRGKLMSGLRETETHVKNNIDSLKNDHAQTNLLLSTPWEMKSILMKKSFYVLSKYLTIC